MVLHTVSANVILETFIMVKQFLFFKIQTNCNQTEALREISLEPFDKKGI